MPKALQNLKSEIKRQWDFEEIYFSLIMIREYFSWREQYRNLCEEAVAANWGKRVADKRKVFMHVEECVHGGGRDHMA